MVPGQRLLVFDSAAWNIVGHDIGDNSVFHKPATVLRVYSRTRGDRKHEVLVDVRFDEGHFAESRGHFAERTQEIQREES